MEKFNKKLSKKLVQKSMSLMTMFVLLGALSVACSNTDKDGKSDGDSGGSSTVAVTGVSLDKTSETINGTNSITLTATVKPSNATNQNVTWKSDVPSIATVDNNGKVTGVSGGTAQITVTTEDGNKTATATITVKHVAVTDVSLADAVTYVGGKITLTPTITPNNATNQKVTWDTGNSNIAMVDQNGVVTGIATGNVGITVKTDDGQKTATALIQVKRYVAVTGVSLSDATTFVGDTISLTATVAPSDASNKKVTWKSNEPALQL